MTNLRFFATLVAISLAAACSNSEQQDGTNNTIESPVTATDSPATQRPPITPEPTQPQEPTAEEPNPTETWSGAEAEAVAVSRRALSVCTPKAYGDVENRQKHLEACYTFPQIDHEVATIHEMAIEKDLNMRGEYKHHIKEVLKEADDVIVVKTCLDSSSVEWFLNKTDEIVQKGIENDPFMFEVQKTDAGWRVRNESRDTDGNHLTCP